jgi:MoaA/NifB/PqqE/SkfB family radical SAM enzyme
MDIIGRKICYYLEEVDNIFAGKLQYPVTCEIDASNYCQNHCSWCIFSEFMKRERVHLDYDVYSSLLRDLKFCGTKSITFIGGGEPPLNPNFNKMIIEASTLGFEIGLVTNGILIDNYINELKLFKFVRVSLDASSEETYFKIKKTKFFSEVVNNISGLINMKARKKLKTDIGISFVVCDENRNEIGEFEKIGNDLQASYVHIRPEILSSSENLKLDSSSNDKTITTSRYNSDKVTMKACHIAGLIGIVCATGKVYYCCIHRGNEKFLLGDLNQDSFLWIWQLRKGFVPDISECKSCRYMNYVKGYEEFSKEKYTILRHKNFL